MTVKLTGSIIIPMDQQADLLPLLKNHIAASLAEPGNMRFEINQDPLDKETFHLDEEFVDQAAFEYHQKRGGASPWGQRSVDLVRDFHKTED